MKLLITLAATGIVIGISALLLFNYQQTTRPAPAPTNQTLNPPTAQKQNLSDTQNTNTSNQKPSLLSSLLNRNKTETTTQHTYPIVDTGVTSFYNTTQEISAPSAGQPFYGQDAHYQKNSPSYTDNNDGTITDNITGLMWQQDMGEKMTWNQAQQEIKNFQLAGYTDWRIPTIKELYSLIQYTGKSGGEKATKLFIDDTYFIQPLGNTALGEREIDAQTWSSTMYTGLTMQNDQTVFGVNFIDGRIKGYPVSNKRQNQDSKMYFRFVRGNPDYGTNNFIDNQNGTVTDTATGLMWQQADSGEGMDWQTALQYAQDLDLAGYTDWRLPSSKELQSIVDYSRSPQHTNTAAIDPVFTISNITDETGKTNYPFFWTSTTHLDGRDPEANAVYIAFGEALGRMNGQVLDVHGAGAQRSDPKTGNRNEYPQYFGPQGDVQRVYNYVRVVRDVE